MSSPISGEHEKWLKEQFAEKHQRLMPKVLVANIYYGCNLVKKLEPVTFPVEHLVKRINKTELAEKLENCLGEQNVQSEKATNYGLVACFSDQFSVLPKTEQKKRLAQVKAALTTLPTDEKHRSFIKCTTEQTIQYIE